MNCNAYFYSCLPSSLSHNTQCQILWLWHALWQVECLSFLSASCSLYFTCMHTRRNWTNHLQVYSIFDTLLQHTNLLLFNNQACFKLLFFSCSFGMEICAQNVHHTGGGTGELHISQAFCSSSTILKSMTSKSNHFFFISGSRRTGNTTKHCYLTTAFHHNKSKMFKEI